MNTFSVSKNVYIAVSLLFTIIFAGCGTDDSTSSGRPDNIVSFDNLRTENITSESAVIRFMTSIETTCEVEYGRSESNLDNTATDPMMGADSLSTDHSVTLDGLDAGRIYYFRARAVTGSGTVYFSDINTFTTIPDTATSAYENIALAEAGTTVKSVSSNFGGGSDDSAFGANKAIDGIISTEWSSYGDGDGAYIELDLGQMRDMTGLGFQSRKMADGSSIIMSFMLYFDNNKTSGPYETNDPDSLYAFDIVPSIESRTVRLEAVTTTGGNTGAKEIQLFIPSE
jgi:hypothetical protein